MENRALLGRGRSIGGVASREGWMRIVSHESCVLLSKGEGPRGIAST